MPESPIDPKLLTETRLPLAGLRVLDLTLARAGPTCVRHLADWGADIIRVEPPGQGDGLGGARDGFDQVNLHRNKRGLSIDLKNPAGHAAFLKLAATADIVVENMRMQVKHRLKIAYDDLKDLNPRLIYASISGFGQTGPYSTRGGVDQIAQGMGGLMTITGEPGRGPMRVGIPINDLTAGNLLAMGIMMKLYDRERTGQGGYVHTSLLEVQVFMLDFQASRFLMDGEVAGQAGNDHPVNIPMGVFPTADKPINIAASSPKLWVNFCKAAGHEEWLEVEEWKTNGGRSKDRQRINAVIAEVTRQHSSDYWIDRLEEAGIPCGPVNDIREVFEDPQVKHLEMAMPMRHRSRGDIRVVAQPVNIEGVETGFYRDMPKLGEHNAEILAEAGLTADEIAQLKAAGALGGGMSSMEFAGGKILASSEGGVGRVVFNQPEKRNAMSVDMWEGMGAALDLFAEDPGIRCVVLAGAGDKAFVSGADISQFEKVRSNADAQQEYDRITSAGRLKLSAYAKPVIAQIRGFCMGGGLGIAMSTDIRIASDDSQFGIPAAKLSIAYGFDMVRALVDLVGPAHAHMILMTGERFDAREAERFGLVNKVVPAGELEATVAKLTATLAGNAPLSLKTNKATVKSVLRDRADRDMEAIRTAMAACFDSEDYREGRRAFMEKRKPAFQGR